MDIPEFIRPEKIPVGAAQERAEDHQQNPENQKPEQERADLPLSFLQRKITVPLGICIYIRDRHQPNNDQAGKDHACQPRIKIDEHFLQAEEIPRRL